MDPLRRAAIDRWQPSRDLMKILFCFQSGVAVRVAESQTVAVDESTTRKPGKSDESWRIYQAVCAGAMTMRGWGVGARETLVLQELLKH